MASVTAMANNITGSYNVTASYTVIASQTTISATFALTNQAGPPTSDLAQGKQATQSSTYPGYPTAGAGSASRSGPRAGYI